MNYLKFVFILSIFLMPFSFASAKSGLEEDGLKGKIKEQLIYKISNGKKILVERRTYSLSGNRKQFNEYLANGSLKKATTFQYQNGKLISSKTKYFQPEKKTVLIKFKHDDYGNLVEGDAYLDNNFYMKRVAKYNKGNQLIEEQIFKSNKKLWFIRYYQYHKGKNVTLELKLPDRRTYLKVFYHYDKNGNKASANVYINGQQSAPLVFEYIYW